MENFSNISSLIIGYLRKELTGEESRTLKQWIEADVGNLALFKELTQQASLAEQFNQFAAINTSVTEEKIRKIIRDDEKSGLSKRTTHRIHFLKTAWFRYAAAILLILGSVVYFYTNSQKEKALVQSPQPVPSKDIMPGGNKALLKLDDGRIIALDSAANGQLVLQQGSSVIKKDGSVIYDPNQQVTTVVSYNTMSTPRGGQYHLTLPDGSQVWLNAASSVTFPTAFTSSVREVSVTGEAYFEVAQNKTKPFRVKTGQEEIIVLGTQFNVNAYPDENNNKVSLVQGAVKIKGQILRPGQAYTNSKIIGTNIDQDIAWKNGIFNFHGKGVEEVMRQLSRWYDIDVTYEVAPPAIVFYGKMGRNLSLSTVLEFLKKSGIHFRLEGNKLKVLK